MKSAIEKMMKLIAALQELERHWAITKTYEGYPPGTNTINPAVIEGGRHAAFIADECRLWITVHYYPNETHEEVIKEIEEHLLQTAKADIWLRDHLPTFKWGGTSMIEDRGEIFPSLEVDPNHPAVKILQMSHETSTKEKAILDVSPTVTDGGWFGDANIPAAIYGPGDLANAHSVNEEVKISQLIAFTKTMISFIYEWTNQEK
jgi:acetylornithine deacetylase